MSKIGSQSRWVIGSTLLALLLTLSFISALAQPSPGDILVADATAGTDSRGVLFSVNPSTGTRTIISDFGDPAQGPVGRNPSAIALDATLGNAMVVDAVRLFSINLSTGVRTLISSYSDPAQGPVGFRMNDVALDTASGNVLVVDHHGAGTNDLGALFSVNPSTGTRTIISDFFNGAQGPLGRSPEGVAVVPGMPLPPPSTPVGGEILGIDITTLLVAGAFANASWMVPLAGVTAAVIISFFVTRRVK